MVLLLYDCEDNLGGGDCIIAPAPSNPTGAFCQLRRSGIPLIFSGKSVISAGSNPGPGLKVLNRRDFHFPIINRNRWGAHMEI
jgi:hypothetical protein